MENRDGKSSCNGAGHTFFEQAVFQGEVGQRLFQLPAFTAQRLDLVTGRRVGGVTGKPLLTRF